ncbi:ROK family protein [Saccharopolyspora sp. CA-218241]|uniref:ROK family protein n=1 Tax=Saccharopolyspora sp. CA-218241 TaxID=3240027 RepID=UPI003D958ED8
MREHGDATSGPSPVDQAAVRRGNLARVLAEIRRPGGHSRAALATTTGLTKATVSSLVAELIRRGLVRESGQRQEGVVGRPGRLLELDGASLAALGLEIGANYLAVRGVDLADRVLLDRRVGFDAVRAGAAGAVDELAELTADALAELRRARIEVVGIGVAVPGLADLATGTVHYAPNLLWQDVPVADRLRERLGTAEDVAVLVDNEANLSALAEFRRDPVTDLVYLTAGIGVGAGLIADGALLRGATGFSGEVGHLPVDPAGGACGCGRHGCLETKIGLAAVVRAGAPDLLDAPRDPEELAAALRHRAEAGQPRVLEALDDVGRWLGIGTSILVNLLNPGAVVLGGYFAAVAPYVVPSAMRELRSRAVAGEAAICRITGSAFGFEAAVRGGASVIADRVFDDPTAARLRAGPGVESA